VALWERTAELVAGLGGVVEGPVFQPPADEAEVVRVEAALKRTLPSSFRRVLIEFASEASFSWKLPFELEERFDGIVDGGAAWSLGKLLDLDETRREHAETWRDDEEYEGTRRWQKSIAWLGSEELDMLAFDLRGAGEPPVVLLESEGFFDDAHACLASDFEDFFDRWSRIGLAGGVRLVEQFVEPGTGLAPYGPDAVAFRRALGLELPYDPTSRLTA